MESPSFFERMNARVRQSLTLKLLTMGVLILLLLIPASMITSLVRERENRQEQAVREVSSAWGHAQTLAGPVLTLPYRVYGTTDDGRTVTSRRELHLLPDELSISGDLQPETRYRGPFEVVLYTTELTVEGTFPAPDIAAEGIDPDDILWDEATVSVGLTDMRGVQERVTLQWDAAALPFEPGTAVNLMGGSPPGDRFGGAVEPAFGPDAASGSGMSTRVPLDPTALAPAPFRFALRLNGSRALHVVPLGKTTTASLAAPWATPSFTGAFLPDSRTVTEDGFTASWQVLHLNRSFPQVWRGNAPAVQSAAFGVRLLVPVDQYQKTLRAAKYAILTIALTFLVFFFAEIQQRTRVHPFQYLLVGLALCLFYVLLLAFAEHMLFNLAYGLAGTGVIALVALYTRSALGTVQLAGLVGGLLVVVYGFIFVLLQLEDYALLVGSLGLFVALALTMYLSRHIDWYGGVGRAGEAG